MLTPATTERYTRTAAVLHWLIAALILTNLGLAVVSANSEGTLHRSVLNLHKSIGLSVLLLTLLRLAWRLYCPPPAFEGTSDWERRVAGAVHVVFYFLMVLTPFVGWWLSSAAPTRHPIHILGWEAPFLPVLQGRVSAGAAGQLHKVLGFTMAALAALHIAAALKHRFVNRDTVLGRMSMLPAQGQSRRRPRSAQEVGLR